MATGRLFQTGLRRDGFPVAIHEMGCHRQCLSVRTTRAQSALAPMVLFDDNVALPRACHTKCCPDVSHTCLCTLLLLKIPFLAKYAHRFRSNRGC